MPGTGRHSSSLSAPDLQRARAARPFVFRAQQAITIDLSREQTLKYTTLNCKTYKQVQRAFLTWSICQNDPCRDHPLSNSTNKLNIERFLLAQDGNAS
jgi:hypothetical protein